MSGRPRGLQGEFGYAGVAAAMLAIGLSVWLTSVLARTEAGWLSTLIWGVMLTLPIPACFGSLMRQDRAMFLSFSLPIAAGVLIYVILDLLGGPSAAPFLITCGWELAWVFAGGWLWPRWTRHVLRRPPDPEAGFGTAWRTFRQHLNDGAPGAELWDELSAMGEGATERMIPLLSTWFCLMDLSGRADDESRAARIWNRQQELLTAYNTRPRTPGMPWPNPDRPTEGTFLELAYPELEALVAAATPEELRALAVLAARLAAMRADALDPELDAALDAAAAGRPDSAALERLEADKARAEAGDGAASPEASRRRIALTVAILALADSLDDVDAARAIYESARTCDDEDLAALTTGLRALVDPVRLAAATATAEVTVDLDAVAASRLEDAERRSGAAQLVPRRMPLVAVAAIGFIAGLVGTVIRAFVWPLYGHQVPAAWIVSVTIGIIATTLVGWLVLAASRHRVRPTNLFDLFLAAWLAAALAVPLLMLTDALLPTVVPDLWDSVFETRTSVMPYSPVFGFATAMVLVAIAAWTRRSSAR